MWDIYTDIKLVLYTLCKNFIFELLTKLLLFILGFHGQNILNHLKLKETSKVLAKQIHA